MPFNIIRSPGQGSIVSDQTDDILDLVAGPGISLTTNAAIDTIVISATTTIPGEQGYTGSRGFTGSVGNTGPLGPQGYSGSQGLNGDLGYSGSLGFTGSMGVLGYSGSIGPQGILGYSGSQGINGYTGSFGIKGYTGSQGDSGYLGSQGYSGSQGLLGYTGSAGSQGTTGFTGSQGVTGFTGSQGTDGANGVSGDTGYTGSRGNWGYTGSTGPTGPSGQGLINQAIILDNVAASTVTNAAVPEWSASYTGTGGQLLIIADINAFSNASASRNWYLKKNGTTVATGTFYFNNANVHTTMPSLKYIDTSGSTSAATWSITIGPGLYVDVNDHATILVTEYTGITDISTGNVTVSGDLTVGGTIVNSVYFLEAYASETYTLPGSFTEDPCRYSYISSNVNISSSWFNTSTYTFTPQKAGYWEIIASYDVYRNAEASMVIKKNTNIVASAGSFNAVAQQVIKIVYLNGSTDYIKIFNYGGAALSRSQYAERSWFQARWIGE